MKLISFGIEANRIQSLKKEYLIISYLNSSSNSRLYSSNGNLYEFELLDGTTLFSEDKEDFDKQKISKVTKCKSSKIVDIAEEESDGDIFDILIFSQKYHRDFLLPLIESHLIKKIRKIHICCNVSEINETVYSCFNLLKQFGYGFSKTYNALNGSVRIFEFSGNDLSLTDISVTLTDKLVEVNKELRSALRYSSSNTVRQIENFISVDRFLNEGRKPLSFHDWPISPDIALYLLNKLLEEEFDLIIELGSGTSTVLISKTLQQLKRTKTKFYSFEHNEKYKAKTLKSLSEVGEEYFNVVHAPLSMIEIDNCDYHYYSIPDEIFSYLNSLKINKYFKAMILVDGPPGGLNALARLPALYVFSDIIKNSNSTVVIDDANRIDEKKILDIWKEELKSEGVSFDIENVKTEKGCVILKTNCKDN